MKHGKKYTDSRKLVDSTKLYEPAEALDLCAKTGKAKFDETVEIHVRLGVDSRHADQQVRGAVVLPNGTGKSVRVLCFARGDAAEAAKAAGAEFVGAEDMMEKIQKENWMDCHCPIGKGSFGAQNRQENFDTLMDAIVKAKPAAAKGQYVRSCVVATTMGPGVKINPARFVAVATTEN